MTTTLDPSVVYESDAIEKHFCVKFEKLQHHAMTEKLSEAFMKSVLIEKSEGRINIPEEEKPHVFKIIEKRLEVIFDYTMTDELKLFITILCETPGKSVMYLWYLQYVSKNKNIQHFTCENFASIFPNGFPCEKDLNQLWDEQKINRTIGQYYATNLLDFTSAGVSLFSSQDKSE
jgi:hypothetical protein